MARAYEYLVTAEHDLTRWSFTVEIEVEDAGFAADVARCHLAEMGKRSARICAVRLVRIIDRCTA